MWEPYAASHDRVTFPTPHAHEPHGLPHLPIVPVHTPTQPHPPMQRLMAQALQLLPDFSAQNLANCSWALATLKDCEPVKALLEVRCVWPMCVGGGWGWGGVGGGWGQVNLCK